MADHLRLLEDVDIKITEAICGAFESGRCYSACNPFYSGHYETADEALRAARKTKAKAKRITTAGQTPPDKK